MDYPGITAGRDDASERFRVDDSAGVRIDAAAGGRHGVQVADGIGEVRVVEQVEELRAEFDLL
jgi:hypothetical protein